MFFHLTLETTVKELTTLTGGGVEQGAYLAGADGQVHGTLVGKSKNILFFFTLFIIYLLLEVYYGLDRGSFTQRSTWMLCLYLVATRQGKRISLI